MNYLITIREILRIFALQTHTVNNQNMKKVVTLSLLAIFGLASCNDFHRLDNNKSKEELTYEQNWNEIIGEVDPEKDWKVSIPVSVTIMDAGTSTISIYSLGEEKRTLLAREDVASEAVITFDIPIGLEKGIAICRECDGELDYRHVSVENLKGGSAVVSFTMSGSKASLAPMTDENRAALTKPTCINPITGKRAEIFGYSTFPAWIWEDMNSAIPEDISAKLTNQITNFEMQSNGLFYVSTVYGATGNTSAEIGYYYYDPATPNNKIYIPLVDALNADFYYDDINYTKENAPAKVMWLDNSTWNWNPANFCYYDKVEGMGSSSFKTRTGDDQYNVLSVLKHFGNKNPDLSKIAMIKGLTFQVDAPKGNMVGFYCKKGALMNHTTTSMNSGKSRAAIKIYDGFRFIGLEDGSNESAKEPDCNDIALIMVPGNNGTLPGLLLPYIKDEDNDKYYNGDGTLTETPKYDIATDGPDSKYEDLANQKMVWTLAFEDISSGGDCDFNDIILTITPDQETNTATVTLCATGGSLSSYIYYKEELLGEVHQLLGSVENGHNVIANTFVQRYALVDILTIDWPEGHSIDDEVKNFKIIAGKNTITVPEIGEIPKAICVPGFWYWPKEVINIDKAYPLFRDWATGDNNTHANWYNNYEEDKVVKF